MTGSFDSGASVSSASAAASGAGAGAGLGAFGEVIITDAADPRLDDFRNLKKDNGLVIGEGPLIVGRMLESRFPTRCIVGFGGRLDTFLESNPNPGVPVYRVTREIMGEVAGFDLHRGLIASADRPEPLSIAEAIAGARTVVVAEGVGDHENIGSIFRNGAGMDVDAVLFGAGCADPLYRRSVRVSMGHVLRTPFAHFAGGPGNWHHSMQELRDAGFRLVSLTPDPEATHIAEAVAGAEKVAFLVGAEGPGLTERTMRFSDVRARIPMSPGTDSLNLATACAIAFYERQRDVLLGR